MTSFVDPATLRDQPLRLRRIAKDDYMVMVKDHRAGRILAGTGPGMSSIWTWTVTGPYVPMDLMV